MIITPIPKDTTPNQYRFSGYQLPKLILDETGPAYVILGVHPYYTTQPGYWQKPAYQNSRIIGGNVGIDASGNNGAPIIPQGISNETGLFTMLDF